VVEAVAHQVAAGEAGQPVRLMFADEARFGRGQSPRLCRAPPGVRPRAASRFVREHSDAFAALGPRDGVLGSPVLPAARTETTQVFLTELARRHPTERVLPAPGGAGWHWAAALVAPPNVRLIRQPAHRPQLNPVEHLWEEYPEEVARQRGVSQPGRRGRSPGRGAGDA
jgi:hypothetical protein